MEMRPVDRFMLLMLSDIYERLELQGVNPTFIREALYSGHDWAFEWEYPGIFAQPVSRGVVDEVADILDMWSFIEEAGGPQFPGFDSNREGEFASVARFMTEHMGRFTRFKGRTGQGVLGLDGYRRMCSRFEGMRPELGGNRQLTEGEIEQLIAERTHPDNR